MEMRAGRGRIKLCIHFLERFEDWVESDYCRVDSLNRKSGGAMKGEGRADGWMINIVLLIREEGNNPGFIVSLRVGF